MQMNQGGFLYQKLGREGCPWETKVFFPQLNVYSSQRLG